jgi:hypothetical protein
MLKFEIVWTLISSGNINMELVTCFSSAVSDGSSVHNKTFKFWQHLSIVIYLFMYFYIQFLNSKSSAGYCPYGLNLKVSALYFGCLMLLLFKLMSLITTHFTDNIALNNCNVKISYIRGSFEKFVDWRQCVAIMQREAVIVIPSCIGGG